MTTTTSGKYDYQNSVRIEDWLVKKIEADKKTDDENEESNQKDLLIQSIDIATALYLFSKYPNEYTVKCRIENFMGEPRAEYYLMQERKGIYSDPYCYNRYWIVYSEKHYIFTNRLLADSDNGIIKVEKVLNILAHNDSYIIKTCAEHVMNEVFTSFYLTRSDSYDSRRDLNVYRLDTKGD